MRNRSIACQLGIALVVAMLAAPSASFGHSERQSYFPNFDPMTKEFLDPFGHVPEYRRDGQKIVVCREDSGQRIDELPHGAMRNANRALLDKCEFRNIQAAVDAAKDGTRILLLPGIYRERPSRDQPDEPQKCEKYKDSEGKPSYEYHLKCPNAQNLIAIMGDDNPDDDDSAKGRRCNQKCNLQIEGTARKSDVVIRGDRAKLNVIRGDRAFGLYLRNFTIEYSDFNNIYVLETNGFALKDIRTRYSREYGILSFASDHGLYDQIDAYGAGDSGIYPGSGPEGHCQRYGIEIRDSKSHHNNLGYSGTAGNGVWAHDNRFYGNSTGMVTDSFAAGHPGMPQDCAKWERNLVYSNNYDIFNDKRDEYCRETEFKDRDLRKVCPTFQNPTGTGLLIAGGNGNIIRDNVIWDNWRQGAALFFVPAALRGEDASGQSENDGNQVDTSNENRYINNRMGMAPNGKRDLNGVDFWWDEEGKGNCWKGNKAPKGDDPTTDPPEPVWSLKADCPGSPTSLPDNGAKTALLAPCATWDPNTNPDPPGCRMAGYSWFERPPEPK